MFNFYNYDINSEPIADYGAHRTLGMAGSLTGYIQTGNSFDKRYYKKPGEDIFESSKKKAKSKRNKIIAAVAIAIGAAICAYLLIKKGIKIDFKKLSPKKLFSKNTADKSGDYLNECFDSAQKHLDKLKSKQNGAKSGDFLNECFDSAQKHIEKIRAKQA